MAAMPWLLILLAVLVLVTYMPLISLFLPSMML
jgi:TRAP-type C4-dicarboxylate transport system permease large subunit